jgi:ribosomal protein L32
MFYSSLSRMGMNSPAAEATETRDVAEAAKSEADLLQHDIDRLLMISEALWGFVKKQHGYTDDDLVKAVGAIDLRNSGADKDAQEKCPTCGRMVSAHRRLCLYCGNPVPESLFERER